jgi:signal transduction histidine kinase
LRRPSGGAILAGALVVLGLGLGLVAEWAEYGRLEYAVGETNPITVWLADLVTGFVFVASGALAARRRPDSLVGPLLMLAAGSWFMATLIEEPRFGGTTLQSAHIFLYRGFLAHAIVTFPSGRPSDRVEWAAVLVGYATAVVAPLWRDPAISVVLAMLLAGVAWRSFRHARGVLRQARRVAATAATALALTIVVTNIGRWLGLGYPLDDVITVGFYAVLVLVAVGLTVELTHSPGDELTDIVVDIGGSSTTTLTSELARLLDDPTLRIWTRSPVGGGLLDEHGRSVADPDHEPGQARDVIALDGQTLAIIACRPGTLDDPGVHRAVLDAVRLMAYNVQLRASVRQRVDDVAASRRRLVLAGDAEGERLARRVDDGVNGHLSVVRSQLARAQRAAATSESILEAVERAGLRLAKVEHDLLDFAAGLGPRELAEGGLVGALTKLGRESEVPMAVEVDVPEIPAEIAREVYMICAEALSNTNKHAHASSVRIALTHTARLLRLSIADDGVGGASLAVGSGLGGLADRVESLGGRLSLRSDPGQGTTLTAWMPIVASGPSARGPGVETRTQERPISLVNTDVTAVTGT